MNSPDILRLLADGNYHRGGLNAWHLGIATTHPDLVATTEQIMAAHPPSEVAKAGHTTKWTKPKGHVQQWSLFTTHGRTNDTSDDFNYGNIPHKKPLPGHPALAKLGGELPALVNMRLNLLWPGAALSPHEEHLPIKLDAGRVALRARFHLPIATNPGCRMLAGGGLYHFEAGRLYCFNNGAVHSATNDGATPRAHLVWDQLMTQRAVQAMFGDAPPVWLEQDVRPAEPVDTVQVDDYQHSAGMSANEFDRRTLTFHPEPS